MLAAAGRCQVELACLQLLLIDLYNHGALNIDAELADLGTPGVRAPPILLKRLNAFLNQRFDPMMTMVMVMVAVLLMTNAMDDDDDDKRCWLTMLAVYYM